jgi:hypothetical protein
LTLSVASCREREATTDRIATNFCRATLRDIARQSFHSSCIQALYCFVALPFRLLQPVGDTETGKSFTKLLIFDQSTNMLI